MSREITGIWFDEYREFLPVSSKPSFIPDWILDARGFPVPRSGTLAVGKTSEVQHPWKRDRRPYGPQERKPAPTPPTPSKP